ncbi:hypothetical protein PoB_002673600 [Plakobranchus ocellatus]|uniref:Uncharacterized protein n=1 Tax=Plakobranchus ocellatus TaxID=259542 RepID=A0AAV3ZWD5_9GAST|nr:hypothetical protein PoB_002673600 [Plakobranchus ocellatus]
MDKKGWGIAEAIKLGLPIVPAFRGGEGPGVEFTLFLAIQAGHSEVVCLYFSQIIRDLTIQLMPGGHRRALKNCLGWYWDSNRGSFRWYPMPCQMSHRSPFFIPRKKSTKLVMTGSQIKRKKRNLHGSGKGKYFTVVKYLSILSLNYPRDLCHFPFRTRYEDPT